MTSESFPGLEEAIGYQFTDRSLLARAMTHSSLSNAGNSVRDLERLEFLGDRVLGLLTAEELWRRFPDFEEGELAPRLNALVRKESCAKAASFFGLGAYIRMSDYEAGSGGREKVAILGDVMEALLGAIYIDGGIGAASALFAKFWSPNLEKLAEKHQDPKTALQEWTQNKRKGVPRYEVKRAEGPAHAPSFTIEVSVPGLKSATGEGKSKRAAQMAAARAILVREGLWADDE